MQVEVYGNVAYVAQTTWIQSGTVRDNILYGKPMDKTQYKKAIKAWRIEYEWRTKKRIQLARAVYNDDDIYLLDDPFSVVDAHIASTL